MADNAGQWHAPIDCYAQNRRAEARSNWLLWPKPQAERDPLLALVRANPERRLRLDVARKFVRGKSV